MAEMQAETCQDMRGMTLLDGLVSVARITIHRVVIVEPARATMVYILMVLEILEDTPGMTWLGGSVLIVRMIVRVEFQISNRIPTGDQRAPLDIFNHQYSTRN